MKTRSGFVSNSSSSSFVCWTTKELSDRALATMNKEEQDLVRKILRTTKFVNIILVGFSQENTEDGSYFRELEYTEDMDLALDKWRSAIKNLGVANSFIEYSVDL